MPRRASIILGCLVALLGVAIASAAEPPGQVCAVRQAVTHDGLIFLWGGGEVPPAFLDRFAQAAAAGPVAVVTGEADPSPVASLFAHLAKIKNVSIQSVPADSDGLIERLARFRSVWIDVPSLPPRSSPLDQVLVSPDFAQATPPECFSIG